MELETVREMCIVRVAYGSVCRIIFFLYRVHLKNSRNATVRGLGTRTLVFRNHQLKMVISGSKRFIFRCAEYVGIFILYV